MILARSVISVEFVARSLFNGHRACVAILSHFINRVIESKSGIALSCEGAADVEKVQLFHKV